MKKGVIVFFNRKRGFGFIKETATGQDYYVTYKSFRSNQRKKLLKIEENTPVEFEVETEISTGQNPLAKNVVILF